MKNLFKLCFINNLIRSKLEFFTIRKKLNFGFSAILTFMASTVIVTVIGLMLVRFNITSMIEDHQPTINSTIKLNINIKDATGSLGLYLLSKDDFHKDNYHTALKRTEKTLQELKNYKSISNNEVSLSLLENIAENLKTFKSFEDQFFKFATNSDSNFPGFKIASENLNPVARNFLQNINSIIFIEKGLPATIERKNLLMAIESLRYSFSRSMVGVRSYLGDRSTRSLNNIYIFQEKGQKNIDLIQELSMENKAELDFEQADSFEEVKILFAEFFNDLDKIKRIHSSAEWRQDSFLMKSKVGPLLLDINIALNLLENNAQQKIEEANEFLMAEVVVIIIVALTLLFSAFIAAKFISRHIINSIVVPLETAVEATSRIAAGDLTVTIAETSEDEIGHLICSLNKMSVKLASLVSSVKKSGIQVTSTCTEISATAKQQEATVTEQAATANQISTTATEISDTVQELVKTMDKVTKVTERTVNSATSSQSALGNMEQTMFHMLNATSGIGSKLSVLSEKASKINGVVTTITKVADQTNLLSLNAAIEAEKAGEYGVGFSVVATEIRRLADQTAVATWDIEQMVKEMQSAVAAGVMGMDKFTEEVRLGVEEVRLVGSQQAEIIEEVQALLPNFEEVHLGIQNQSLGAQQITESITQLSDGTQQSADSLRQSNSSINILYNAATTLQDGVSKFKLKDSGFAFS